MHIQNLETQEKLIQRLKRIEGQVRGVEGMLSEERDCQEIMQQLSAIRSAVQSTSRIFLHDYALACMMEMSASQQVTSRTNLKGQSEKMVQEMMALLDKTP